MDPNGLSPGKATIGIRAALVVGFNIEAGIAWNLSDGTFATLSTIGVGIGVEAGIGDFIPGGELNYNERNENMCDLAGASEDTKVGVIVGISASKNKDDIGMTIDGIYAGASVGGGVYWNYTFITIYLPDGTIVKFDGNTIFVENDPNNKFAIGVHNTITPESADQAYGIIMNGNMPDLYSDTHTYEECAEYYARN